jgi:UDP-glucose 4-epimerase
MDHTQTRLSGAKVLVTGGAGFIGSHLVDRVLADGADEVHVVDSMVNGREENLHQAQATGRVQLHVEDVCDASAMEVRARDVDIVFHLACLGVRHSLHDPIGNHRVNADGTLVVLQAALRADVDMFVHVSSSEVFGTAQHAPMDESHPTWPETVYGAGKLAGEACARAHFRTYRLPVVVARPFNTYGTRSHFEGDSGEVIPRTIVRALCGRPPLVYGDGRQTRDFMHVSDTVAGLVALVSDRAVGRTVNLGSGTEISINELVTVIAKAAGRPDLEPQHLPDRPGDVRRLLVDPSLVHELTGFVPRTELEHGLEELVAWFANQDETPEEMLRRIEDRNWEPA